MWDSLADWEKRNNALAFIVVSTEEIREDLAYYEAFYNEANTEQYICEAGDIKESLILEAIHVAYKEINMDYGVCYGDITDACYHYIVESLKGEDTKEYKQMELELQGETNAS